MNQQHSSFNQSHPWLGRCIGEGDRYRLEERLGGGGMGEVFLATDTRLGKPVALKLLREALAIASDLDLRERFERECSICASLKSVHIVQVSDYGVTSEGYPFYVMEYLQGQTLGELLSRRSRLSVHQTCNILTQVCEGLQLAHSGVLIWNRETNSSERIKVVHRDLKPDNIFLVSTVLGELAKIIDFGIAKINSLQAEYTSATTVFLGTCHYASPEQFDSRSEVDERADIYSLGVILYEMLTGIDPFGFDFRNNRITNNAWLSAHASKTPQPLRSQPNCEHISPELEAIVMRCLAKSPADRFATVTALKEALQAVVPAQTSGLFSEETVAKNIQEPGDRPNQAAQRERAQEQPPVNNSRPSRSNQSFPTQPPGRKSPWILIGGGALLALCVGVYAVPRLSPVSISEANPISALVNSPHQVSLVSTFSDNSAPVMSAVLSPNGEMLISGGADRDPASQRYPIKIWNVGNQQVLRTLEGHTDVVQSLSLGEDGQILASGSLDHTIKIWSMATGELLQTLEGHTAPVRSVALSRDGQTLISGSDDKTVRIWNLQTKNSRTLSEHFGPVYSVAISPDGKTIASGGADKTIRIWNMATGELIRTLGEPGGHREAVSAVAFSADGQQIASAGWDGFVKLWNSSTGQLLQTFEGHTDRVVSVTFVSPQAIASASFDRTVKIWDTQTGQVAQTLSGHTDQVLSVTSLADQTLASSSGDTTIKIWR